MKRISLPLKLMLLAAGLLLMGFAGFKSFGFTQAALQYSDNYEGELNTEHLYVQLNENGVATEVLLTHLKDVRLQPEVPYQEVINVTNVGNAVDMYVRVTLHKYWLNEDGTKDTTRDPALIELNETGNWILDETQTTAEQRVYYYSRTLAPGESSAALVDLLTLDEATAVCHDEQEGNIVTTVYEYDGHRFGMDARVDAVQTHNAAKAIASAWGRNVNIAADGTLSLA